MIATYYNMDPLLYDGANLQSLYAYKTFNLNGPSIVSFCGPCRVDEHLVDFEDKKNNAFIRSENMLHFIIEHFDIGLTETIFRQRLFIAIIKDLLPVGIKRQGDDLYWEDGKLSVSIATASPISTLIHIGLNISNRNTPVKTASLEQLRIFPEPFARAAMTAYQSELSDIAFARCKVRGVS